MSDADEALKKAHEEWVAARAALDRAEESHYPSLLSEAYGRLYDREREAYEALIEAQVAALKPNEEA